MVTCGQGPSALMKYPLICHSTAKLFLVDRVIILCAVTIGFTIGFTVLVIAKL